MTKRFVCFCFTSCKGARGKSTFQRRTITKHLQNDRQKKAELERAGQPVPPALRDAVDVWGPACFDDDFVVGSSAGLPTRDADVDPSVLRALAYTSPTTSVVGVKRPAADGSGERSSEDGEGDAAWGLELATKRRRTEPSPATMMMASESAFRPRHPETPYGYREQTYHSTLTSMPMPAATFSSHDPQHSLSAFDRQIAPSSSSVNQTRQPTSTLPTARQNGHISSDSPLSTRTSTQKPYGSPLQPDSQHQIYISTPPSLLPRARPLQTTLPLAHAGIDSRLARRTPSFSWPTQPPMEYWSTDSSASSRRTTDLSWASPASYASGPNLQPARPLASSCPRTSPKLSCAVAPPPGAFSYDPASPSPTIVHSVPLQARPAPASPPSRPLSAAAIAQLSHNDLLVSPLYRELYFELCSVNQRGPRPSSPSLAHASVVAQEGPARSPSVLTGPNDDQRASDDWVHALLSADGLDHDDCGGINFDSMQNVGSLGLSTAARLALPQNPTSLAVGSIRVSSPDVHSSDKPSMTLAGHSEPQAPHALVDHADAEQLKTSSGLASLWAAMS